MMHERVQKALGNYARFSDGVSLVFGKVGMSGGGKFGQIDSLQTADGRVPVWEKKITYPYQFAKFTPAVASESALDTDGGTGAHSVYIEGNDQDGNPQTERILLSGLSEKLSQLEWSSIYRMWTDTVGSGGSAVDVITCGLGAWVDGVPSIPLASINNGNNQSQMCMLTVPKGFYCAITSITYTADAGKPVRYQNEIRVRDSVFDDSHPFRNVRSVNVTSEYSLQLDPPALFGELTDVRITALATQNLSRVECSFRYKFIPKELLEGDPGGVF